MARAMSETKLKVPSSPSIRSSCESDVGGKAEGPGEPLEPLQWRRRSCWRCRRSRRAPPAEVSSFSSWSIAARVMSSSWRLFACSTTSFSVACERTWQQFRCYGLHGHQQLRPFANRGFQRCFCAVDLRFFIFAKQKRENDRNSMIKVFCMETRDITFDLGFVSLSLSSYT